MRSDREQLERQEPALLSRVSLSRRSVLLGGTAIAAAAATLASGPATRPAHAQPAGGKPNILVHHGRRHRLVQRQRLQHGHDGLPHAQHRPHRARKARVFTDWYGQQSCTAGRAAFITGQSPIRTGLTKVGLPGAELGLGPHDPSRRRRA